MQRAVYSWDWGGVSSPQHATVFTYAKIWGGRSSSLGAGCLGVVGHQPGEIWLCLLRSWALSPPTSPARQSKQEHFPLNLPCLQQVRLPAGLGTQHPGHCLPGPGVLPSQHFLGCSNPQYFGREAGAVRAVYQQEYPWVAMATWASPWEPRA